MPHDSTAARPIMPQQPEMEKALLSQLFIDPRKLIPDAQRRGVNEEWFYIPAYKLIYRTITELFNANQPVEPTTLVGELRRIGQLDTVGGIEGIMDIIATSTTTALFKSHVRALKNAWIYRRLIDLCNQTAEAAYAQQTEADALVDATERAFLSIRSAEDRGIRPFPALLGEVLNKIEQWMTAAPGAILGIPSGYPLLDRKTSGFQAGDLVIIAARPSMGKTALLLNILANIIEQTGRPVLIFSLEMSSASLAERLLFAAAQVSKQRLVNRREQNVPREDLKRLTGAFRHLKGKPYHICDTPALTIAALRNYARRVAHDHPDLCCIGVDYIQLMRSTTKQAQGNREREVAEISAGLKALAKELGIPIIALAQLNRSAETRAGKNKGVPMMSDLRESGAIEQDADMIALLHRPAYYADNDEERARLRGEAHLNLAKNRNGPTGDVPLWYNAECMQFHPTQQEQQP